MQKNYYKIFIEFLKSHNLYNEEAMKYLQEKGTFFDYLEEENRDYIGCFFAIDANKKLKKIILCVPYIKDEETLIINIHEYTHALLYYKHLGKRISLKNDIEILPMMYEKLYIEESKSNTGKRYVEFLNSKITKNSELKYRIALQVQQDMLEYYKYEKEPEKLQIKAKKLTKKYKAQ